MKIADFCSELDLQLGLSNPEERPTLAVKMLCKAYQVTPEEVAIFGFDPERLQLAFSWPEGLKASGTIPLNAKSSLVARTLREKRGFFDNHFAKTSHGVIFEAFAGKQPIQKILSAPMFSGEQPKGVIQISRKGTDPSKAGADFGPGELSALGKMAEVIGRHI